MKNIMVILFFLYGIGLTVANNEVKEKMRIENSTDVLEQHLKQDERLLDADKNIGFIQAINNEVVNKNDLKTYPDISTPRLALSDTLIFKVETTPSFSEIKDNQNQTVGIYKSFDFTSLLNDKKYFSFTVSEYYGEAGYYCARNQFLYSIRGTTMMFIPFIKSPEQLGTISFTTKRNDSFKKFIWLDHNLYVDSINNNLSKDEQLKMLTWAQQQAVKVQQ